jgi:phosphoglycerate dehydrogenase-like enzyme
MKVLLLYQPNETHWHSLCRAAPNAELVVASSESEAAALIVDADAVLGNRWFLQSLPYARRLRWMQSNSMGVDLILRSGADLSQIVLTRVRGVYDDEVAEHALALALALVRGIHKARDAQRVSAWRREPLGTLSGRRALILGWGGVGQAIARRIAAFGCKVSAVRRTHTGPPLTDSDGYTIWGADWREALPQASLVFLALPLTAQTREIFGEREFQLLPHGSLLVNVGRGENVDETALLDAIRSGRLSGAGLDVFREEPLDPANPLWSEPAVLITPHVSRSPESGRRRWEPVFEENLRRFAHGEPLLHVVDKEAGY